MKTNNILISGALAAMLALGACATVPGETPLQQAQSAASEVMVAVGAAAVTYEVATTTNPAQAAQVKADVQIAMQAVDAFEKIPSGQTAQVEAEDALAAIQAVVMDLPVQTEQTLLAETGLAVLQAFITNLTPPAPPASSARVR